MSAQETFSAMLMAIKPKYAWSGLGLFWGVAAIVLFAIPFQNAFKNAALTGFVTLVAVLIWVAIWWWHNIVPKAKSGKIGLMLSVNCLDDEIRKEIQDDFIANLRSCLESSNIASVYDIIIVPKHIAARFETIEDVENIRKKAGALFLLFIKARKRGESAIVDVSAKVQHKKLSELGAKLFANEINQSWVGRFQIENPNVSFQKFEYSSTVVAICAQHMIGLAAYASWGINQAEVIFNHIINLISENHGRQNLVIQNIENSAKGKASEIKILRARQCIHEWAATKNFSKIIHAQNYLTATSSIAKKKADYLSLQAIVFVLHEDYLSAQKSLDKFKKIDRDITWFINVAFVKACQSNELAVIEYYRMAKSKNDKVRQIVDVNLFNEIENFILRFLEVYPNHSIMYFMLGMLNEFFKRNKLLAVHNYNKFLNSENHFGFSHSIDYSRERLSIMESYS